MAPGLSPLNRKKKKQKKEKNIKGQQEEAKETA